MAGPAAKPETGTLKRDVGLIGLTFVAVSGMMGSGWLFAPLLVAQQSGPAAVLSWFIGGSMILIIALTFAEVSSLLPIAGGIARLPHFSYGNVTSMAMGFTAWVGYCANAPIATLVLLEYIGYNAPWLFIGKVEDHNLSLPGIAAAAGILLVMVVVNMIGVRILAATNTIITWVKLMIPVGITGAIIYSRFDVDNFTAAGGFAPFGVEGIFAGVATGGVIFAFTGFRHAIDLAGEAKNPKVTIPLSLTLSVILCTLIYGGIQVAFIGALEPDTLTHGWAQLAFSTQLGPIADIAAALGLVWVGAVIYGGAIIAPFGGGLVSTASNARLTLALGRNGFLFPYFDFLSQRGVPVRALVLNYVLSVIMIALLGLEDMVALNIATLVLSFTVGPLSVYAFRSQLPERSRGFKVPCVGFVAPLAFVCSALVLYWAGWSTQWHLAIAILGGALLYGLRGLFQRELLHGLELKNAFWLVPFLGGIWIISYLGNFGGGLGIIPFGWDLLACTLLALGVFAFAIRCKLPEDKVRRYLAEEENSPAGSLVPEI